MLRQLLAQSQEFCVGVGGQEPWSRTKVWRQSSVWETDRSSGRVKEGTGALGKRKELGLVTVRPCPRGVQGERRRRFELGGLGT